MKFIWLKRRRAKKCGEAHEQKYKHDLKHQQLEMYVDFGKYLHCNRYLYSKQMHSSDTSCKEDNYACSRIHSFSWRLVCSNGAWEELIQRKNKKTISFIFVWKSFTEEKVTTHVKCIQDGQTWTESKDERIKKREHCSSTRKKRIEMKVKCICCTAQCILRSVAGLKNKQ